MVPSFFLTNNTGAPNGDLLGCIKPDLDNASSCDFNSFNSTADIRYVGRLGGDEPGINSILWWISREGGKPSGKSSHKSNDKLAKDLAASESDDEDDEDDDEESDDDEDEDEESDDDDDEDDDETKPKDGDEEAEFDPYAGLTPEQREVKEKEEYLWRFLILKKQYGRNSSIPIPAFNEHSDLTIMKNTYERIVHIFLVDGFLWNMYVHS